MKYKLDKQSGSSTSNSSNSSSIGTIAGAVVGSIVLCGLLVGIIICCCCCACCSSIKDKLMRKNTGNAYLPSHGNVAPPYYPPQQPVHYNNNPTHYNNPVPQNQGGTHESFGFAQSETR